MKYLRQFLLVSFVAINAVNLNASNVSASKDNKKKKPAKKTDQIKEELNGESNSSYNYSNSARSLSPHSKVNDNESADKKKSSSNTDSTRIQSLPLHVPSLGSASWDNVYTKDNEASSKLFTDSESSSQSDLQKMSAAEEAECVIDNASKKVSTLLRDEKFTEAIENQLAETLTRRADENSTLAPTTISNTNANSSPVSDTTIAQGMSDSVIQSSQFPFTTSLKTSALNAQESLAATIAIPLQEIAISTINESNEQRAINVVKAEKKAIEIANEIAQREAILAQQQENIKTAEQNIAQKQEEIQAHLQEAARELQDIVKTKAILAQEHQQIKEIQKETTNQLQEIVKSEAIINQKQEDIKATQQEIETKRHQTTSQLEEINAELQETTVHVQEVAKRTAILAHQQEDIETECQKIIAQEKAIIEEKEAERNALEKKATDNDYDGTTDYIDTIEADRIAKLAAPQYSSSTIDRFRKTFGFSPAIKSNETENSSSNDSSDLDNTDEIRGNHSPIDDMDAKQRFALLLSTLHDNYNWTLDSVSWGLTALVTKENYKLFWKKYLQLQDSDIENTKRSDLKKLAESFSQEQDDKNQIEKTEYQEVVPAADASSKTPTQQ
jgi:hypothetical protein